MLRIEESVMDKLLILFFCFCQVWLGAQQFDTVFVSGRHAYLQYALATEEWTAYEVTNHEKEKQDGSVVSEEITKDTLWIKLVADKERPVYKMRLSKEILRKNFFSKDRPEWWENTKIPEFAFHLEKHGYYDIMFENCEDNEAFLKQVFDTQLEKAEAKQDLQMVRHIVEWQKKVGDCAFQSAVFNHQLGYLTVYHGMPIPKSGVLRYSVKATFEGDYSSTMYFRISKKNLDDDSVTYFLEEDKSVQVPIAKRMMQENLEISKGDYTEERYAEVAAEVANMEVGKSEAITISAEGQLVSYTFRDRILFRGGESLSEITYKRVK